MYLKSLEINGFKSFGRKVALEFTSPITSVVGPNGSGKSNVAESFRFVLGEQSMKSMRGKRGEDLIYNGSDAQARLNRASVKLVFDNSRRCLPLDFEEVSIERVVHRDGINEYFLNGSQVRLKDVQELLSHAHIGASGHHIISQGEADRILAANPKERRSMIEDALGLKVFQYKKIESQRKLAATLENMKQVESLRRELAPHLKFLKKQVEKIERAEALREELKTLYKEYLKREEMYLSKVKQGIESELMPAQAELNELRTKLEEIKSNLSKSEGENTEKLKLLEAEKDLSSVRNSKQHLNHDVGRIEGELNSFKRLMERATAIAVQNQHLTIELADLEQLERQIELENEVVKIKELVKNFIASYRTTSPEAKFADYDDDIAKLEAEKLSIAESLHAKEAEEASLIEQIRRINEEIAAASEGNREAEREMYQVLAKQNELSAAISLLKSKKNTLELEETEWKREITEGAILISRDIQHYNEVDLEVDPSEERLVQLERKRMVEKMKIRLEELGGGSAEEVMKEYRETEERDAFLLRELTDLSKSGDDLKTLIVELERRIDTEFTEGIAKINREFVTYFNLLFGGGKASLQVIKAEKKKADTDIDIDMESVSPDESAASESGIDINVDLPKKKVKALMMLSGGERALTSIALLFAMSQVNPPPFIILDETDAALDEANSKKYGDMIENLSKFSQLIVITHNRETMSRAGVLYGVTQIAGLSKLLSIKFDEAVAVAK